MDFQLINLKKWSYHTASEDMPHETTFFFSFWSWQSTEDKKDGLINDDNFILGWNVHLSGAILVIQTLKESMTIEPK